MRGRRDLLEDSVDGRERQTVWVIKAVLVGDAQRTEQPRCTENSLAFVVSGDKEQS